MLRILKIIFNIMMAATLTLASNVKNPTTDGTLSSTRTSQPMDVMMIQMTDIASDSKHDGTYHYLCKVGAAKTMNLMCHAEDAQTWLLPHDVSIKLRCPKEGNGNLVAYAEAEVYITSQEMECAIIGGGILQGYIELLITALNTKSITYKVAIYSF